VHLEPASWHVKHTVVRPPLHKRTHPGFLDAELTVVSKRMEKLLTRLPNDITPQSLEELRKVGGAGGEWLRLVRSWGVV